MKKFSKKFLKIFLWILGSLIGLLLLLVLLIQVPAIQNFLKNKAVSYVEGTIGTPVNIDKIFIGLPKEIVVEGFYFEDEQQDTLLFGERLAVDVSLLKLITNEVEINSIELEGILVNLQRNRDSVFNFDYIINAFSSEEPSEEDSDGPEISLKELDLERIRFRLDDAVSKTDLDLGFENFNTRLDKFDLENMHFGIPEISLAGLDLKMDQKAAGEAGIASEEIKKETAEKETEDSPIKLDLGDISLSRINIDLKSEQAKIDTRLQLPSLILKINNLNLPRETANVESFEIEGLRGSLVLLKDQTTAPEAKEQEEAVTESAGSNWSVKLDKADFKDMAFRFEDENAPKLERGIDYMDLDITGLNLNAADFYYSTDTISGKINSFVAQEKSGLDIRSLQTDFLYGTTSSYLKDLYIETPNTLIREEIIIGYPSIESIGEQPEELQINANIRNSQIAFQDILIFVPDLREVPPFKTSQNAVLQLEGELSGKLGDLDIAGLQASGIGDTKVTLSGNITGLPDAENAVYNIELSNFESTSSDLGQFIPEGSLPENISLPEQLAATGNFRGTTKNFSTNLDFKSSMGKANIQADLDMEEEGREKYNAKLALIGFDIGKLIQNDTLGRLSLNLRAQGTGFDPETAVATASGTLERAKFYGYVYEDFQFEGTAKDGLLTMQAGMEDPNIDFDLEANGNFLGEYPAVAFNANLRNLALDSLNLSESVLRFQGKISADFETADPDFLNGQATISPFRIIIEEGEFPLDSISLIATATEKTHSIELKSQFLDAGMEGDYQLTQLAPALTNSISRYYDLDGTQDTTAIPPQQLNFDLEVKRDPLLVLIAPDLNLIQPISFSGSFNSENDDIKLEGSIPRMDYAGFEITDASLSVSTEGDALSYNLIIDDVESPNLRLPHTELSGSVEDNVLAYNLRVDDMDDQPHYRLAGVLETTDGATEFSLNPEELLLNYETWQIPEDNRILIADEGILARNFELSHDQNTLSINSLTAEPGAPLEVVFDEFQLETVGAMISKDTLIAGGTLNGEAVFRNLTTSPEFESDFNIEDFSFRRDTLGNLSISAATREQDLINTKIEITGQDNLVNLTGDYDTSDGGLDFDLSIERLHMKSIQGFTMGNIRQSKGYFSGDLAIEGSVEEPLLTGALKFNDIAFRVSALDTYFQSMDDELVFNKEGLSFDQFAVVDDNENELVFDGNVNTTDYRDFGFDFTIKSNNFQAVKATAEDAEYFYGDLFLDTDLRVTGNLNTPVVNGNININEQTDLSILIPQPAPSVADREGVVEFVDQESQLRRQRQEIEEKVGTADIPSMNVSVNVQSDEEAKFTVIVDQANGDNLVLQGKARINAGVDESGKVSMTGRYDFTKGSYRMSFNFVKREFTIEEGGYIQWTGEPTAANVNMNAIYQTEAAPIDLLDDQITGLTGAARNVYKQPLPFQAVIQIRGELLDPEIDFDLRLAEGNFTVAGQVVNNTRAKLQQLRQQPSLQNKQVFSLLVLNRFMGEDPFSSEAGGGGAETLARQSVSRILSQQLNALASDLIAGVQLQFDVESGEDYTTGERETRTDLNAQVSKKLLNDRLQVTIGSSFALEGSERDNQDASEVAGDIAVDYFLSKDGRYILRAYRKNQNQVALQGQVVETGVMFIISLDYDEFSEIFQKQKIE